MLLQVQACKLKRMMELTGIVTLQDWSSFLIVSSGLPLLEWDGAAAHG
jgi:hypothetical protein